MPSSNSWRDLPPALTAAGCVGVMLSNAFPDTRETPGATLRAIEEVLRRLPGLRAVQTVDIPFADERAAVRRRLGEAGLRHTYTLTRLLQRQNLSSLDPGERAAAVEVVRGGLRAAAEAGAGVVGLVSGRRPAEPARRHDALVALEQSLREVCREASALGLAVAIEPLDHSAHKRGTLGTTDEGVALCRRLAEEGLRLGLCLDTAHVVLNGEAVRTALAAAWPHLEEFHFCNAITDPAHPLFGDHHLPFHVPGRIGRAQMAAVLAQLGELGAMTGAASTPLFCEVRTPPDADAFALLEETQALLQAAWADARGGRARR